MTTPRVLFILKRRPLGPYGSWNYSPDGKSLPSGLSISASQMALGLNKLGIANKLVQVVDNNCIDREVTAFNPTHVIIEAFWVVPSKFEVLQKLHPTVKWVVRNHSKSDFLSHEGGMVGWAIDYIKKGIILACNSPEATADFRRVARTLGADPQNVVYLPNYYDAGDTDTPWELLKIRFFKVLRWIGIYGKYPEAQRSLHIGCFGAVRPLKNHLHQALAAIETAEVLNRSLNFYINATRIEGKAEPIVTSLRQLFARHPRHRLVEIGWMGHEDFKKVIRNMDIVSQVSNSETFNIVSADSVLSGVPVLVSSEVPWLDKEYHADPSSVKGISSKMWYLWRHSNGNCVNEDQLSQLKEYSAESLFKWNNFLTHKDGHLGVIYSNHW